MSESKKPRSSPRKKARWGRRLVVLFVVVLLLLVGAVVALPPIVSSIAPGEIEAAVNPTIKGSIEVEKVKLSLFGGQQAGPIRVLDANGKVLGVIELTAEATGLRLITGNFDLGEIVVTGNLDVTRAADGTIDLAEAVAPTKPSAEGSGSGIGNASAAIPAPKLPRSLSAKLILDKLNLTYTDAALSDATGGKIATAAIRDFAGQLSINVGKPISGSFKGTAQSGASATSLSPDGDAILAIELQQWTDATGALTLDAMTGDIALSVETIDASLQMHLLAQNGVLTLSSPAIASIDLQPWANRLVAVQDALASTPGLTIEQFPSASLTIDSLRVQLPKGGAPMDLRSAAASVRLSVGPMTGSADPASMGMAGGGQQKFSTTETTVNLTLAGDQTARFTASGAATVGSESAGTLSADMAFGDMFDAQGAFVMPAKIEGSAALTGVATAILDPFIAAVLQREGEPLLRLTDDLGPTLDLSLSASAQQADGPIALKGNLTSERLRGALDLAINGKVVTSPATDAVVLTFREPAPMLRRVIPQVRLSHADPIELKVSQLSADLGAIGGPAQDLRSVKALVTLSTGTLAGSVNAADGSAKAFGAGPITGSIDATEFAQGRVALSLNGSGAYDGKNAGTLKITGSASELLDASGAIKTGAVPQVNLTANMTDISSALLAAFVPMAEMGLDPARDIGPLINASLTATNPSADELHADLRVNAQHLEIAGPLSITSKRVTARAPITITQTSPTVLLTALTKIEPPLTTVLDRPALVRATVSEFTLPLGEAMAPQPQNATAQASFLLQHVASAGVVITSLTADAKLNPAAGASMTGKLVGAHGGKGFGGTLEASASKVFDAAGKPLAPMAMQPAAKLELRDAPLALARFLPKLPGKDGKPPMDLASLASDLLGGPFTVVANFDAKSAKQAVSASIDSPLTKLDARASLDGRVLSTEAVTLSTRVTGPALANLLAITGSAPAQMPSLAEPAVITLRVEPLKLPLTESFAPDGSKATGNLRASGTIAATVTGLAATGAAQGPIKLSSGEFSLDGPLAALLGASRGTVTVQASGDITAPSNGSGSFTLSTNPTVDAGKPAGPFTVNAALNNIPVAFVDALTGQPGLLVGAVGPTLSLDLAADINTAAASAIDSISLGVRSQRVNTTKPLKIASAGDTLRLSAPAELRVLLDPAWANEYLLGAKQPPAGAATPPPPLLALTAPTDITLKLNSLVLPASMSGANGAPGGPLKLGVFAIDASVDLPQTALAVGEAKAPVAITGGTLSLKPTTVAGATLDYDLRVQQWTAGGKQSQASQPSRVWGTLFGLASASGQVKAETLNATGSFELPNVPTALIDAFARNDLPTKALGDTVSAKGWYREVSSVAGAFRFEATSPNAVAAADGSFRDGFMLINKPSDGSPVATISRITPALTADLAKALPLLKSLEKTAEDTPAKLVLETNVAVPIDGNMNNLSGYFSMDMGSGRFVVQNQFMGMLKIPGLNEQGRVGRRLETLKVVMDRGVIAYQPYSLPLGEFKLISVGVINLSDRAWQNKDADLKAGPGGNLDVITYIPGGAVAQEIAGPLGVPLGIGPQVMVPFRTRGPLDNSKTEFDAEHFAKEALSPENIIKGVGDLLGKPGGALDGLLGGGR